MNEDYIYLPDIRRAKRRKTKIQLMLAGELLARYYNVIIDITLRYYGIVHG